MRISITTWYEIESEDSNLTNKITTTAPLSSDSLKKTLGDHRAKIEKMEKDLLDGEAPEAK